MFQTRRIFRMFKPAQNKRGSANYRKNEAEIFAGRPPARYTRILPFVPGERILELGSAEGVLALLLSREKTNVIGLERNADRHAAAVKLQKVWVELGIDCSRCSFINGSVEDWTNLFADVETIVAIRAIYHFREALDPIFAEAARHVRYIVLGGNRGRQKDYRAQRGVPGENKYNKYASDEGMRELLNRHGYIITAVSALPDPLVVGERI